MKQIVIKLFLFPLILLIVISCGFKTLDQKNLNNFTIQEINVSGSNRINFKIKNNILSNNTANSENILLLNIKTIKEKKIKEKNIKNQITKYQTIIKADVQFELINKNQDGNITLVVEGDYLVGNNYSETINNEKKTVENLTDDISRKIIQEINLKLNDF